MLVFLYVLLDETVLTSSYSSAEAEWQEKKISNAKKKKKKKNKPVNATAVVFQKEIMEEKEIVRWGLKPCRILTSQLPVLATLGPNARHVR